jgi:hypothetical protein
MDLTLIIIVFFWSSEAVVTGGTAGGDNQPLIIIVDRLRYADDHPFATRQPDFRGERFTTQGKPPTMKSLLIPVGLALALWPLRPLHRRRQVAASKAPRSAAWSAAMRVTTASSGPVSAA